jgi:hypothetical protein
MLRLALTLILICLPLPALAWGAEGHEIVAAIALRELTPAARLQVARLLGSEAMLVHDSNWADEIRDQRPQTGPWHYVDIALDASGYDAGRDCGGNACVVAQISNDLQVLGNARAPAALRAEALRFLVHFVADIHQPLHAVDNGDKGGNAVRVYLRGERTNMHHVWDVEVVQNLGWDASSIASDIAAHVSPAQKKAWQSGTPAAWANESHAIARDDVYAFLDGRRSLDLPPGYLNAAAPVVRQQLARAGVRLAWLINRTLR